MKKIIFTLLIVLQYTVQLSAQKSKVFGETQFFSEEFVYNVRWGFINLGKIIIGAYKDYSSPDETDYILSMHVISSPDIPFVYIDEYNETIVSIQNFFSKKYYGKHCNSSERLEIRTTYDPQKLKMFYSLKNLNSNKIEKLDTFENVSDYLDGPSLFYFTRFHINSKKSFNVPTIINGEIHKTSFNFNYPTEEINIDAIDYPIMAKKYSGMANWKGGTSAGLSGEFKGWISDDDASVVLRAEVKVWVGSISIELEKWYKPGWKPESYNYARVR